MDGSNSTYSSNFANEFARRSQEILGQAEPAMTRLGGLATALKMPEAKAQLDASLEGLRRPQFNMIIFGRFKSGKSTFLNVLLGRLERPLPEMPSLKGAPLIMHEDPATARLTTVRYGDTATVTVVRSDGRREAKSLKWYHEHAMLHPSEAASKAAFGDIDEFEMTYPFENGRVGIVLVDTPGTDEAPDRTAAVQRALSRADAAIVLFSTFAPFGEGEVTFMRDMKSYGLNSCFVVVNLYNRRQVNDRLRHLTWEKLVRGRGGPDYDGQDLASERIYFVDALAALEGRLGRDEEQVRAAGVVELERALNTFYETERRKVHVQRWTDLADTQAVRMLEYIANITPVLTHNQEEFQRLYDESRPRIAELRERSTRVPKMFAVFRERAAAALITGFQDLLNDIRDKLKDVIDDAPITELDGLTDKIWATMSMVKRNKAVDEVNAHAGTYISKRIHDWASLAPPAKGARRTLEPLFEELIADLEAEVHRTEKDFEQLAFDLSGFKTTGKGAAQQEKGKWWERIGPAAAGAAFGPDMMVIGATQGWTGFGKTLLVHMGVFGAIAILAGGPVTMAGLALGWVTAFVLRGAWMGSDLGQQIKNKVLDALLHGDPKNPDASKRTHGIQDELQRAKPWLETAVAGMVGEFEAEVTKHYQEEIDEKIRTFEEAQRQNALARDEKARLLEEYGKARAEVTQHRATLANVRRMAAIV